MTLFSPTLTRCAVCNRPNIFWGVVSTNSSGMDLDTRPTGMARGLLNDQIRCCSRCGYCAYDISKKPSDAAFEIIHSESYQAQLNDKKYPALANRFLCSGLLFEADKNYTGKLQTILRAAWACDDAKVHTGADICRKQAIGLLTSKDLERENLFSTEDEGTQDVLLADLLRRTRQFDQAVNVCKVGLEKETSEFIQQLLNYEKELAQQQDANIHTVQELTEPEQKTSWLRVVVGIFAFVLIVITGMAIWIFLAAQLRVWFGESITIEVVGFGLFLFPAIWLAIVYSIVEEFRKRVNLFGRPKS